MDDGTPPCIDTWRVTGRKPGKVCRSLFGPVDHAQVRAELQEELRTELETAKRRWAFDFQREQPVQGDVQWEAVSSHNVPHFYRASVRGGLQRGPQGEAEEGRKSQQLHKARNRKRKQTVITDYYTMKRRFGASGSESKQ